VSFDADPLPMLRELAESQSPDIPGRESQFELEITGDGSFNMIDLEDQQPPPFH